MSTMTNAVIYVFEWSYEVEWNTIFSILPGIIAEKYDREVEVWSDEAR